MEVKTIRIVTDDNGNELTPGKMFFCTEKDGCSFAATYRRLNEKNNLVFENPLTKEEFAKRPASVISARPVQIEFEKEEEEE